MSTQDRRQRERRATEQEMLSAALRLLLLGGEQGLTMRRVAAETGFTVGNLYAYFRDKSALLGALQQDGFKMLEEVLERPLQESDADQVLRDQVLAFARFLAAYPALYDLMLLSRTGHQGALQAHITRIEQRWEMGLERSSGRSPSDETNLAPRASVFWRFLHGIAAFHLRRGQPAQLTEAFWLDMVSGWVRFNRP